ncbi:putative membrane protein [Sphingomonas vulcanisoli]|uniref:Membrane protein n=1 Tax=Sphingomonas vulcanisoli TaxID=1658060 RepID=A0ABX0TX06_9SPHN|nr:hypothetical protein [Sphingomonas vulcanisoli]NIJ08320.1 putative membrane protein [Sphingomonas vulcanisoli]
MSRALARLASSRTPARQRSKAAVAQALPALVLPGVMAGLGLFVGIGAARSSGDMMVGIVSAGLAALMLVAVLQTLGLVGGR